MPILNCKEEYIWARVTTTLYVNGVERVFSMGDAFGQVPYSETLLETLRDRLGLTAAKRGCDEGACGCCTVILNGEAVPSCMKLTADCDGGAHHHS